MLLFLQPDGRLLPGGGSVQTRLWDVGGRPGCGSSPEEKEQAGMPRPGLPATWGNSLQALGRKPSPPGPTVDLPHRNIPYRARRKATLDSHRSKRRKLSVPKIKALKDLPSVVQLVDNKNVAQAGGPEGTDHPNISISDTLEHHGSSSASGSAAFAASSTTACINCSQTTCSGSSYSSCHCGLTIAGLCPTYPPGGWLHSPTSLDGSADYISCGSGAAAISCVATRQVRGHWTPSYHICGGSGNKVYHLNNWLNWVPSCETMVMGQDD